MKYKFQIFTVLLAMIVAAGALNAQQKYALIIGGDYKPGEEIPDNHKWNNGLEIDPVKGYDEFWNDTYLMWKLLYDYKYRYSNDNIKVLFADGIDYSITFPEVDNYYKSLPNFINIPFITDAAATEYEVEQALIELDNVMTEKDYLFIWIMSNGGNTPSGDSYVYLWGYPDPHPDYDGLLYDYESNTLLDDIEADKKVVIVQAPNSGGFATVLEEDNTIVYTSSDINESASRANDTPYDENEEWEPIRENI